MQHWAKWPDTARKIVSKSQLKQNLWQLEAKPENIDFGSFSVL